MLPQPGSPLIGAGGACEDPAGNPVGPLAVDQRGEARPLGGPCDTGAVQIQAPSSSAAPSISAASPGVGQTVTCNPGTWSGDGVLSYSFKWLLDGTPIAGQNAATYTATAADAGQQLSCEVAAVSSYNLSGGPATSAAARVTSPAAGATGSSGGAVTGTATPADPTPAMLALRISARESRKTWREVAGSRRRRHAGTSFAIALNAAARITLTFRHAKGNRPAVGSIVFSGRAGANTVRFSGRLHGRRLAAGRYVVTISAARTGYLESAVSLSFRVTR